MAVSPCQKGNPVLAHIKNVTWAYAPGLSVDFAPFAGAAVLWLSLRYHALNPAYLLKRMKEVRADAGARIKVVLVLTDVVEVERLLLDVGRLAILAGWTLVCAASLPEGARYLETYKAYEHKPATAIRERVGGGYLDQAAALLTTVRAVNETDVRTLLSRFRSIAGIARASLADLQSCPGIAETKAKRIFKAFHDALIVDGAQASRAAEDDDEAAGSGGGGGGGGGGDDDDAAGGVAADKPIDLT